MISYFRLVKRRTQIGCLQRALGAIWWQVEGKTLRFYDENNNLLGVFVEKEGKGEIHVTEKAIDALREHPEIAEEIDLQKIWRKELEMRA